MLSGSAYNEAGHTTSLIGRAREVAEIHHLLTNPQCRMLTLTGPGGIGKTRLALEVIANLKATANSTGYTDGVYFVALQPLDSPDLLAPAIATAAGISLGGSEPLTAQLVNNLRQKQMLLLLDNFEHLSAANDLLVEIVHTAPSIRILVTSREAIGVREEWLYPVHGLPVPGVGQTDERAAHGAIELFEARARQVQHNFEWQRERQAVISICRQVEGNPLALELAASWLNVLSCTTIDEQIRQGLDILTSPHRSIPARHRSMRAVFNHSWQLLGPAERTIFARITVFRGGFTLDAARAIAHASLPEISSLVAKSLLHRTADNRYHIHELLRQFGAEQLAMSPEEATATHHAHADYFLAYVYARRPLFDGPEQRRAFAEVDVEYENLHAALQWAVAHFQLGTLATAIRRAVNALTSYLQVRGRYLEGAEMLAGMIRHFERAPESESTATVLAECVSCYGWLAIRLGRLPEAKTVLTRAIALYDHYHFPPPEFPSSHPKMALLFLSLTLGDYAQAEVLGEEMRQLMAQANLPAALSSAYYGSAAAALARGEYERARQFGEQALALRMSLGGKQYHAINIYDILGQVAVRQRELAVAKRHFETGYDFSVSMDAHGGMALHLKNLGDVALCHERWQEAHTLYEQSRTRFQAIGDRGAVAEAERGLAITAYHLGDLTGARRHFCNALELVVSIQSVRIVLTLLASAGAFIVKHPGSGRGYALGRQILAFVIHHPTCDHVTHETVSAFLQQHNLPHEEPHAITVETLIAALQAELTTRVESSAPLPTTQSPHFGLIEPLTDREIEVVRLLAAGCSNAEIATKLVVAIGTVKAHTSNIYRKLDVATRSQAIARLHSLGLLE